MSGYDETDRDILISTGMKFNAWIQKLYSLHNAGVSGPRNIRLYGVRSRMPPTQDLVNAMSWFYTLEYMTESPKLKYLARVFQWEMGQHADLHSRFPLPYEDLDDVFRTPSAKEMTEGFKVASASHPSQPALPS